MCVSFKTFGCGKLKLENGNKKVSIFFHLYKGITVERTYLQTRVQLNAPFATVGAYKFYMFYLRKYIPTIYINCARICQCFYCIWWKRTACLLFFLKPNWIIICIPQNNRVFLWFSKILSLWPWGKFAGPNYCILFWFSNLYDNHVQWPFLNFA